MTTPDPTDVHTGTDRVELTEGERRELGPWNSRLLEAAVASIVAARTDDLRRWKSEALDVMDGLQELGEALKLPLGERITGPKAVEAVQALTADRTNLAEKVGRLLEVSQELCAERDAARAELAAANARIRELEEGKDGPYACCRCCPDDDPEYHAENPPNSHSTWCKSCGTPSAIAERDALQATLDRISALADEWEAEQPIGIDGNRWSSQYVERLRAALTPEGKS